MPPDTNHLPIHNAMFAHTLTQVLLIAELELQEPHNHNYVRGKTCVHQ